MCRVRDARIVAGASQFQQHGMHVEDDIQRDQHADFDTDDAESLLADNESRAVAQAYTIWAILDYRPSRSSKTSTTWSSSSIGRRTS